MNIYPMIVERLRQDPAVIDDALCVLDRWDARGIGPERRRAEWRTLLMAARASDRGRKALIDILIDTSENARRLKDFAPFAGILPREDRRRAFLKCTYDH